MHDAAPKLSGFARVTTPAKSRLMPLDVRGLVLELSGQRLIDGIDLRLDGDGITMVMGQNGAGKSLLLRLLHGLIDPTAGSIQWAGKPMSPAMTKRQALVFQKPVLLRRSAAANVDFVLRARGGADAGKRDALLERVGLLAKAKQPARLLSGGEQQRLALARALATEPEVLFLDEPTASLDPASAQSIEKIVRDAAECGTRVIFVTHDIGQARRLADEILFLARGKVVEHCRAGAFFETPVTDAAKAYLSGRLML